MGKRLFWILWIVIGIFLYKDSFVNNRIMHEVRTIRQADTVCIVLSDNKKSTAALPNNADDYEYDAYHQDCKYFSHRNTSFTPSGYE